MYSCTVLTLLKYQSLQTTQELLLLLDFLKQTLYTPLMKCVVLPVHNTQQVSTDYSYSSPIYIDVYTIKDPTEYMYN